MPVQGRRGAVVDGGQRGQRREGLVTGPLSTSRTIW
jgi:hypothetical protein